MDDELEWVCGEWSAWKIWLHPVAAREVIDESAIRMIDIDNNLKKVEKELDCRSLELDRVTAERDALKDRLAERDRELAAAHDDLKGVREALDEARDELATQKSVDEKLAEFNLKLNQVEEMKRNYEKRIEFLENKLRSHMSRRFADDDDELAIEEPVQDERPVGKDNSDFEVPEWIDLSEKTERGDIGIGKKAEELQRSYQQKRAHGLPENIPDSRTSDGWLFELPDNL